MHACFVHNTLTS